MPDPDQSPPQDDDDLILSIWNGDEDAKGQLIVKFVPALERSIGRAFRRLHSEEIEDIVAEAIRRFWVARMKFDPERFRLRVCLYRVATQVANEYTSRRLAWQKARKLERSVEDDALWRAADPATQAIENKLDALDAGQSELLQALKEEFAKLPDVQQDIWEAFADADDFVLDSGRLGIELGNKYQGGVPYTAVNIRVMKLRAKDKLRTAMKARGFDLKQMGYIND